jgi:hypothetical protein
MRNIILFNTLVVIPWDMRGIIEFFILCMAQIFLENYCSLQSIISENMLCNVMHSREMQRGRRPTVCIMDPSHQLPPLKAVDFILYD